jgi:hypothetical protein
MQANVQRAMAGLSKLRIPKPVTQKTEKKQPERDPEPESEKVVAKVLTAYEERMLKIRERQEKIRQLASQAF